MRKSAVPSLWIVLAICVCLAVGVAAQKGSTPTYVWSVTVDPNSPNLEGPMAGQEPIPFVNNDATVRVSAGGPSKTYTTSNFELTVAVPPDLGDGPWLGYRNLGAGAGAPGTPCRYPRFNAEGGLIPDLSVVVPTPGCVVDFMNHQHPQMPYRYTRLWITLADVDIMTMPWPSTRTQVKGAVRPQIAGPDCTTAGNYSRVAWGTVWSYTIDVSRLSADEWKVQLVDHPMAVHEWISKTSTTKRGAPTCVNEMLYPATITNISASLTWQRTRVK